MIDINWQPSTRDLRIFAVGQVLFFAFLATAIVRRGGSPELAGILVGVSSVAGLVGTIKPSLVRPIYAGWMIAVFPIGWCVSHLLLGMVFWLVIVPLGLALRCCGVDPLERRTDKHRKTYWTKRPQPPAPSRYFRKF